MADDIARLAVDLTATNNTAAGAKAAEKTLSESLKRTEKAAKSFSSRQKKQSEQAANDDEKANARRSKSMFSYARATKTAFMQVEKAAARTFGVRSVSSGLSGMLTKSGNGLAMFSNAMAEVGEGAGALSVGLGTVATGIGAIAGVAIAGVVAAQKFGAAWAENTAKVSRFAKIYGVGSETLQAFNAAAELNGAAKGSGMQGIAGLEDSLNGSVYGDADKQVVLARLGIKLKRKKDGSVDLNEDTLASIADKISTRNPYGQRQIASQLGIPLDLLPLLSQGGKALRGQMAQSKRFGNLQDTKALADAERVDNKNSALGQSTDRSLARAGQLAATSTEGVLDREIAASQAFSDAIDGNFKSSMGIFKDAAKTFSDAVDTITSPSKWFGNPDGGNAKGSGAPPHGMIENFTRDIGQFFGRIVGLGEHSRQDQVSPKGAVGVSQLMPSTARQVAASAGIPWDEKRFRTDADYNRNLGLAYTQQLAKRYHGDKVLTDAAYNAGPGNVDGWIKKFGDPSKGEISDADFAKKIPFKETRDHVGRVVGNDLTKVHVTVEVPHAPPGTKATVRTPGGAVSNAFA